MITHLVGWNLVADDEAGKATGASEVKAALEGLVGVVPGLLDLTVSRNGVPIAGNSDLALVAHYDTADDLRAYIVHPAHEEAVVVVKRNTKDRWAIDLEA
jgi:heme-degrading monooxygenase HmoA